MDYYGADRKLSELGEQDLEDFLEQDMFTPPANDPSMDTCTFGLVDACDDSSQMDNEWLDNFFDDPVLNDRMMTEALQPRRVQSEHSYSLTNGETITADGQIKLEVTEKDVEGDLLNSAINPNMTLTSATTSTVQTTFIDTTMTPVSIKQEPAGYNQHEITMATNSIATSQPTLLTNNNTGNTRISSTIHPGHSHPQTLLKQPTIILATSQHSPLEGDTLTQSVLSSAAYKQERYVLPKVNIKLEASCDSASDSSSPEHTTMYDSIGLPPTPPSSSNSDSEGGHSPQRSAPPSPIRHSQLLRQAAHAHHTLGGASAALSQPLFTSPIPTSGVLMLSEEEKRTLIAEGYPIPNKLPLTKQEEKNLKKIRRKIKNKISAQESRRKKKEYLETLEKKVEAYNSENSDLRKKLEQLENNNRSLLGQLQKLQALVAKVPRPPTPSTTQTGTCLMVLVLFFAVFLGTWSPLTWSIGYNMSSSSSSAPSPSLTRGPGAGPQAMGVVMTTASPTGAQPIGPEVQEPMSDSYATPNMRSRVLLSLRDEADEQFGPHTPIDYKSLFSGWFSGELCPGSAADSAGSEYTMDYTTDAPKPDVSRELTEEPLVSGDANPVIPSAQGDLLHSYTARVMAATQHQQVNTTA